MTYEKPQLLEISYSFYTELITGEYDTSSMTSGRSPVVNDK